MMKKLRVTVDGKVYEVTVEVLDEGIESGALPAVAPVASHLAPVPVVAPVTPPAPAGPAAVAGAIKSPLAGKVMSVEVKPGQDVKEGQQIMTLEAMKMNTYIYAPKTGRISTVQVNPGDAVEEGAVLMVMA
jgi:biotin carboxyl carrier protein